jgi:hypothetical protein
MNEETLDLLHERYELRIALLELGTTIDGDLTDINKIHLSLLEEQFESMAAYYLTLCERIRKVS